MPMSCGFTQQKCPSCWPYMPNTGCQESLLIQITQEPRLTETSCHDRDFMCFYGRHNNRKGMSWDKHWLSISPPGCETYDFCSHVTGQASHIASFKRGRKMLSYLVQKYLVNKIALMQGTHICACVHTNTQMCIESEFKKRWIRFHTLWNLIYWLPYLYIDDR